MIRSFRTAIWTLGSGIVLIATAALSREQLPRSESLADWGPGAARIEWQEPAEVADTHDLQNAGPSGMSIAQTLPSAADQTNSGSAIQATVPPQTPEKTSAVFQNASLQSASRQSGRSIEIGPLMAAENAGKNAVVSAAKPVVVLKPDERPIAGREKISAAASDKRAAELGTRVYHPNAMSVLELERLIRPLLTPGIGTATASTITTTADNGPADGSTSGGQQSSELSLAEPRANVLLVHDRPEILHQIDAIYADLEAAPKRVVIDALIADVALPDSVPPGWELRQSRFGVIDAEPRIVLNSLRVLGRVSAIASNQLQVIDRQWAQLEWTERGCRASAGSVPVGDAQDASLRLATILRIRPSVLSSGLIRLEVHPTSSRLKEGSSVRPEIATVAFTTDIVLHAGATAVIAGSVDERPPDAEPAFASAKGALRPGDAPCIHPQPRVRHETVLLVMPRISREN
jgi:hypothetical protein